MADIATIKKLVIQQDETADIPIYSKTREPYLAADGSPATIGVIGSESLTYRKLLEDVVRRARKRSVAENFDPVLQAEEAIWLTARACTRWHGWDDDGKPVPFSHENAEAMLSAAPHIKEQVEHGIERHAAFFVRPSPSSSQPSATKHD